MTETTAIIMSIIGTGIGIIGVIEEFLARRRHPTTV